jgi:hypothetical protein
MTGTRLITPSPALASCVRAYIVRSTLDRPLLPANARLNHFPASPLCSITWFIEGEAHLVDAATMNPVAPLSRVVLAGPQSGPTVSYNPGPVRAFMLLFYPHALHRLTGIAMPDCVDRFRALDDVFDADWLAMAQNILCADDDEARVQAIEQFLLPRWQQVDCQASALGDWVRRMAAQAATAGWGQGVRNLERRIKTWAGQPLRKLRRLHRAETSFLETRTIGEQGESALPWTEVAQRAGYADQAHFCRETRAISGLSPSGLARAWREEESYWIYRVWS